MTWRVTILNILSGILLDALIIRTQMSTDAKQSLTYVLSSAENGCENGCANGCANGCENGCYHCEQTVRRHQAIPEPLMS